MLKPFKEKKVWHLTSKGLERKTDLMAQEALVHLFAGEKKVCTLMATPGMEKELCAGFLVTMGLMPKDHQRKFFFDPVESKVVVDMDFSEDSLAGKSASGGPLGDLKAPKSLDTSVMDAKKLMDFVPLMFERQSLFKKTGATHAVGLFDLNGEIQSLAEDVGRHNALDKAVGNLWLKKNLSKAKVGAFSGRMSLEMVMKSAWAGLVFLISVSAPTTAAIEAADDLGLTLAGFSRGDKVNIYTHGIRVRYEDKLLSDS